MPHALVLQAFLLCTAASPAPAPTATTAAPTPTTATTATASGKSGVARGWEAGLQSGALIGGVAGVVVIPAGITLAAYYEQVQSGAAVDAGQFAAIGIMLGIVGAYYSAIIGAAIGGLGGGALGAAAGAAGYAPAEGESLYEIVALGVSGSARAWKPAGPTTTTTTRATMTHATPAPPSLPPPPAPLAADPADAYE